MDGYFAAKDDEKALAASADGAGPYRLFETIEVNGVFPCPHLEQLVEAAGGETQPTMIRDLAQIWPEPVTDPKDYVPGPSLHRVPDLLRDRLAAIAVDAGIAERWAPALWGVTPADAETVGRAITDLARRAQGAGERLYWWAEL
ncbi:hypothetical protein ABDK56_05905 [Sphingomonas sp. ASV193]|uniref:hypothetical protein n=1 Tax=Sphingomonas sp. ASV193 TaxID=3144405 RepID=UPI0032E8CA4E